MLKKSGFTIIELIIAIAVLAILETLAVASYHIYITKSRRNYAEQVLLQNVQYMERFNAQNGGYATGSPLAYPTPEYTTSPETGTDIYYNISFMTSGGTSANNYTLIAHPRCNTSQSEDGCICADKSGQISENQSSSCDSSALCACQ